MSLLLDEQTESENSQGHDDEITSESMSQNIKIGIQIGFLGAETDYYDESQSKTGTVSVLLEDDQKDKEEPIQSENSFSQKSQKSLADSQKSVEKQFISESNLYQKVLEQEHIQNFDNKDEEIRIQKIKDLLKQQISLKLQMSQAEYEKIQNQSPQETQKIFSNMQQAFNLGNTNIQKVKEINSTPKIQEQEVTKSLKLSSKSKKESLRQKTSDLSRIVKDRQILSSFTMKNEQKVLLYQKAQSEKNMFQILQQKSIQSIKRASETNINSEENRLAFQNSLLGNSFLEETKINKRSFRRNQKNSQPSERSPQSQNSGKINQSQKNQQKNQQKLEQEKEQTKTKFLSSLFEIQHLIKNIYCSNNFKLTTAAENRQKQNEKSQIQEEDDSNKNVKDNKMWQRMIKLISLKNLMNQEKTNESVDTNQQDLEKAIQMSYSTILEDLRENDLSSQAPSNYRNNIKRRDFNQLPLFSKNVKNMKQSYILENNLFVETKQKPNFRLIFSPQKDQNQREDSDCSQIISPDNKSEKSFIIFSGKKEGETPQPFIRGENESLNEKKYFLRQMTQKMNKTEKSIVKISNKSQKIGQDQNSHMIHSQQHQRSLCLDSVSEVNLSQSSSDQASNNLLKDKGFKKTKRRKTVIQIGSLAGLEQKQDELILQGGGSTRNKNQVEENPNILASLSVSNSYKIEISQKNKSAQYQSIEQYQVQENEIKDCQGQLQKVSSTDNDASKSCLKKQCDHLCGRNYSEIESISLSSNQFRNKNNGQQIKIGGSLEAVQSKRRMSQEKSSENTQQQNVNLISSLNNESNKKQNLKSFIGQDHVVNDDNHNLEQDQDISQVKQKNQFFKFFLNDSLLKEKGIGEAIEDQQKNKILYQTSKKQIQNSDYIFCNQTKQQNENFKRTYFKGKNLIKSLQKIQQKCGMTKEQLSQNLPKIIDTIKKNQFDQKCQEQKEITLPQSIQNWQFKVLKKSAAIQNLQKRSVKKLLDSKVQEAVFMKRIVDSYEKDLFENIQQIQNLKENLDRMKKQKNSEKKRFRRRTIAPQFLGQMSLQEHHLKQIKNQQMQMQFLKKQTQVQQKNSGSIFESENQLLKLQDQNFVQANLAYKGPSSGISSGVGQVNQESCYNQQNYESLNGPNVIGVKSSSGFSKTNCASNVQNKQSINSRNNQNVYNSVIEQDNSGFLSSVSGKGAQEEIIGVLAQDKLPNELSSINFQSQIFGSKRSSKNKEQSQKSGLDQTQDQDEYYDSEGESDSEYYDEEESCSEIGPHNFSKYRITDIRSQSMAYYSVDDSVQGRSIEQLPFQNSICFSPNQSKNNKLIEGNNDSYFIQSNQKNNQVFKNYKNDFSKSSELNQFENLKYQRTLLNQKQQDNQRIESFLNKQKYSSEIDMQLAFLQQKTEILRVQNESSKFLKGQRLVGLSRRSDNTKDKKILTRKFKSSKYEAKTPKSVSNDISNLLQFQLRNQNKQQSDNNSQMKIPSAKQGYTNFRVTDELKHNLIIDNSLSECKNSSIGGSPFSKKFPQNFYNNCDIEVEINQNIQNIRKKISDNMLGQQSQQIQQEKISTGSLDNFGNLFDKVALQNIQPIKNKDLNQLNGSNMIQQQFTQELGYETNDEDQKIQNKNDLQKTSLIKQENNIKQTNFSEASYHQLQQRQTTLKKIKRDKMVISSNDKKRKSILVTNNNPFLFSNEQKIPKNELLNPFSLSSNLKKQQKTKQFQQARKQELDTNNENDLLKPVKTQQTNEDENKSPSNTSSSRLSNASSTFLSKYTISTSSCVSQKKGGKKQINQYVITHLIGQGSFSKVKQVINCETKEVFAMKIINKGKLKKRILSANKLNQFNQIEKEVAIMKKMAHPHIVKLVEIIDDPNHHKQYLICQYVPNGSLLTKINSPSFQITEAQARKYFRQLCSAVWYCHEVVQIFHRDIKPDNILIDNEDNIKLTDFGVSHSFEDKKRKRASLAKIQEIGVNEEDFLQNNAGSDCFFSPEACTGEKYSGKSADIWACAVTLYQMVFGKLPFNSVNRINLYEQICKFEPNFIIEDIKLTECIMQNELKDLLQKMLSKHQKNRLNFSQIQSHPWITANGQQPCNFRTDVNYKEFSLDVTQEDLQKAVTQVEQIKNVKFKRL